MTVGWKDQLRGILHHDEKWWGAAALIQIFSQWILII